MENVRAEVRRAVLALCGEGVLVDRLQRAFGHLIAIEGDPALQPESSARLSELIADLVYGGDSVDHALSVVPPADRLVLAGRILAVYEDLLLAGHADRA